ncbi:MAG: ATP-binding cassette domain-containing protein [Saprospiraceae bacterium]
MRVLEINQLTKKYGAITAVNNLSLNVEAGQIMGILGPNGSGKTTTLGSILHIIRPNSGSYTWFEGKYGKEERMKIGALLETPNFYPYLSAVKNLDIIAHIKKVQNPKIDELLELVNLFERRHSNFRTYSYGMKQRLAIAGAMIGDPEVLIFDEPTNGLDPQGIAEVRGIVKRIAGQGKTIIMASHILDEVEKVCSHVAIIKKGNLLAMGGVGTILNNDQQVDIKSEDIPALITFLSNIPQINNMERNEGMLTLYVDQSLDAATLNKMAFDKGIVLTHLVVKPKSLETEFLQITGSN